MDLQYFAENGTGGGAGENTGANETGQAAADTGEALERPDFQTLIEGEYRSDFQKKMQGIIDARFKKQREAEESRRKTLSEIGTLLQTEADEAAILEKLREQTPQVDFEAAEKELREKVMPGFSMEQERENKDFERLLLSGVSPEIAYRAVHMDEILGGAMAYTASKVRENLMQAVSAGAIRPAENGLSGVGSAASGVSVKDLTDRQLIEIEQRALRGEKIRW